MATEYDVVIVGGGLGGYVAAIRASQLGLKTAVVEKEKLGGICLHKGCIPTKALLRSAEVYYQTKNSIDYGIISHEVQVDFSKVQQRKNTIVQRLYEGVHFLMKKRKIDVYEGTGRILGPSIFSPIPGTISVEMNDGSDNEILKAKNVIIATGSRPKKLPGLEFDAQYVLSSDEMLELEELPKSLLIVGGGVIGVEWASMMSDFGVEVTIVEYASSILPVEDDEICRELQRCLKRKKIKLVTNAEILPHTLQKNEDYVEIKADVGGTEQTFVAEKVLVSVGRQANVEKIGIENTDIIVDNGYISTNSYYQTKESHIYAIGDCIGGMQLAHVASHEGMIAVEHMANKNPHPLNPLHVPRCVYSSPEVASIGLTENEAKEKGYLVKIGKFPFKGVGKALVLGDNQGFVKIIADQKSNDILGIHMIGPHVTDLISEAGLAKILEATPWELSLTTHPHPSLSEAIGEAALAVEGLALHS